MCIKHLQAAEQEPTCADENLHTNASSFRKLPRATEAPPGGSIGFIHEHLGKRHEVPSEVLTK